MFTNINHVWLPARMQQRQEAAEWLDDHPIIARWLSYFPWWV